VVVDASFADADGCRNVSEAEAVVRPRLYQFLRSFQDFLASFAVLALSAL
jgi:hypothetical protein